MAKAQRKVADKGAEAPSRPRAKARPAPRAVNKSTVCQHFGWTRYEFDQAVGEGMPVVEAAPHKGAEWRVDLAAVERWMRDKAEAEAEAQRRRAERWRREQEAAERAARERERAEAEKRRARREAERRAEAAWTAYHAAQERHRNLSRVYGICCQLARDDVGGIPAITRGTMGPEWRGDWPHDRPSWWMPPPGMLEAFLAEPSAMVWNRDESHWRQWWPGYVPGRPWPYRDDSYVAPVRPSQPPPTYR